MRKLVLSFLLSCGVGLTMFASPAQVCDDDNVQGRGNVTQVAGHVDSPVRQLPSHMKHEVVVKKMDRMVKKAPKRVINLPSSSAIGQLHQIQRTFTADLIVNWPVIESTGIGKNPRPVKPGGHGQTQGYNPFERFKDK